MQGLSQFVEIPRGAAHTVNPARHARRKSACAWFRTLRAASQGFDRAACRGVLMVSGRRASPALATLRLDGRLRRASNKGRADFGPELHRSRYGKFCDLDFIGTLFGVPKVVLQLHPQPGFGGAAERLFESYIALARASLSTRRRSSSRTERPGGYVTPQLRRLRRGGLSRPTTLMAIDPRRGGLRFGASAAAIAAKLLRHPVLRAEHTLQ